ncbi:MAG TPA: phage tail protein [Negativicutes bacterium]|nr:phage tail protein [Negativicutes bacterium]
MGINLEIDASGLKKIEKSLYGIQKQIPAATASALNRTLDYTSTQWGKLITRRYSIKTSDVKGKIKKFPASKLILSASMNVTGSRLSFVHFPYTPKVPGTNKQVKVKVKKESGYKQIGTKRKPFVATTGAKSADKTQFNIFKRTTNKRLPIVVLRTLSLPQMASNKEVSKKVQSLAQKKLGERIEHEIKWRLEKAAKGVK